MLTSDRVTMRRFFVTAWRKARSGEPLEPMERQIADTIRAHPEYHSLMEDADAALSQEFQTESGESKPFLHQSMNIAIQEQVATDRPPGIRGVYRRVLDTAGDAHEAEHRIMECLAQSLWEAQRGGTAPNEHVYLTCVKRLIPSHAGRG
jgi:hypothetical protein